MPERCFCPDARADDTFAIEGDEAHHLVRVRRVGLGSLVEVFNGRGFAVAAEVVDAGRSRVSLRPIGPPLPDRRPSIALTLATAVPKGDRFDWLVEKATELGVERLIPVVAERSVVDPRSSKLDRLRRLVIEASKQCGRNTLMSLETPRSWSELLTGVDAAYSFVAHPGGRLTPVRMAFQPGISLTIAIGPEGGFTDAEVAAAESRGWGKLGLGPTILRIETAGIAGAARLLAWADGVIDGDANKKGRTDER